jgi:hypothetical protein
VESGEDIEGGGREDDAAQPQGLAAGRTDEGVDLEDAPEESSPGRPVGRRRGQGLAGEATVGVGGVRSVGRRAGDDKGPPGGVGCEDAVVQDLVLPGRRDQGHQVLDEFEGGEVEGGGAVGPGCLQVEDEGAVGLLFEAGESERRS